jgi:hypothetical protein
MRTCYFDFRVPSFLERAHVGVDGRKDEFLCGRASDRQGCPFWKTLFRVVQEHDPVSLKHGQFASGPGMIDGTSAERSGERLKRIRNDELQGWPALLHSLLGLEGQSRPGPRHVP